MRRVARGFKRHFGVTAKHVAVRSQRPWYWSILMGILLLALGFVCGSWRYSADEVAKLTRHFGEAESENQQLRAKVVHAERQLQVERAAQSNLTKELAQLQDEDVRLKEDLAFYQNILNEKAVIGELKLQSFKLNKASQANQYEYHIMLVQSGKHDAFVKGSMKLALNTIQGGKIMTLPLTGESANSADIIVNFKYFQRIDGVFTLPSDIQKGVVEANFFESGVSQPRISQKADLPT